MRVRPLSIEDRAHYRRFLDSLEESDLYQRTLGSSRRPDERCIEALLDVDRSRAVALAAVDAGGAILGVARAALAPDRRSAEFALIVASGHKRRGIGKRLLVALIDHLRRIGVHSMRGETFAQNQPLLGLARTLRFRVEPGADGSTRTAVHDLDAAAR